MLRAVIFDMDGVIVDSEPLHIKAEKQIFARFGISVTDQELQEYMGRTPKLLLEALIDMYRIDVTVEEILPAHKANLLNLYRKEVELIPGAQKLITLIRNSGVDLALASSSNKELIDLVLEKFHFYSFFKVIVSGEEIKNQKPCPDIFHECIKRLDYDMKECVVIEDSNAGIQAAKTAGVACIGFRSPNSGNQDLTMADFLVDDLTFVNIEQLKALVDPKN